MIFKKQQEFQCKLEAVKVQDSLDWATAAQTIGQWQWFVSQLVSNDKAVGQTHQLLQSAKGIGEPEDS